MVEEYRGNRRKRRARSIARYIAFAVFACLLPAVIASSARAGPLSSREDWAIGAISILFAVMLLVTAFLVRNLTRNLLSGFRNRQQNRL
ncbi:hypothetical protein H2509_12275 [Stappia sp. F7233]|uniref:Uncharacterized protein n=1 Tax=Stappia albiluteola TaxID=2758565 RepID=A0A839AHA9_9HYPH|nr:hypothetical protein [Stappia albiluteola]MBA5777899.1 hypothetical protein [Stappia albiluteola]